MRPGAGPSAYELVARPTAALALLPRSCSLVFDCLAVAPDETGCVSLSLAYLGEVSRLSKATALRAVRRLAAEGLLLFLVRGSQGRGHTHVYLLRPWLRKRFARKPKAQTGPASSPQGKVSPPPKTPTREKTKSKDLKTHRTRGGFVARVRRVTAANESLTPIEREALTKTAGRLVFKLGWWPAVQADEKTCSVLLADLGKGRPPGLPPRGAPLGAVYRWAYRVVAGTLGRGMVRHLLAGAFPGSEPSAGQLPPLRTQREGQNDRRERGCKRRDEWDLDQKPTWVNLSQIVPEFLGVSGGG
jgi:hypothetical protein